MATPLRSTRNTRVQCTHTQGLNISPSSLTQLRIILLLTTVLLCYTHIHTDWPGGEDPVPQLAAAAAAYDSSPGVMVHPAGSQRDKAYWTENAPKKDELDIWSAY